MVLIIDGFDVGQDIPSLSQLFERHQLLKANSVSLINRESRRVEASESYIYVGQKEAAVVGPSDSVGMIGSEDATTCHIVILRDSESGVTGLAHLDSEEPNDFLTLERAVRDRRGVRSVTRELEETMEYEVSILGGYSDENSTSEEITEMLLTVMQGLKAIFRLKLACLGQINTEIKEGVAWPRIYGGGVIVETGEVFAATFPYHGPDTDIRGLRLHARQRLGLANIYDYMSGKIVIQPFAYQPLREAHLWVKKTDEFLLRYCSTSPLVEPPSFCANLRAGFRRMISDPQPMKSLFPGDRPRIYSRNEITGEWTLEGSELSREKVEEDDTFRQHNKEWGVRDFMMSFK